MKSTNPILFFILLAMALGAMPTSAQTVPLPTITTPNDSLLRIEILPKTRRFDILQINDSTTLQVLAGNVKLRQGKTLFFSDSCIINKSNNTFEAWGNVHINDADTSHAYSNHLKYLIKQQIAYLDGNVKLTDGKGVLTAPSLDYDVQRKMGTYKNGGKLINGTSTLTSKEGYYYTGLKDVYFKKEVKLIDPDYELTADSLLYNTESGTARFIAQTYIKDKNGRLIETRDGFYNLKTGKAEFGRNPIVRDGAVTITGERFALDEESGIQQVEGNAVVRDTAQGTTVVAGIIFRNTKTDAILATRKPLLIIKQEKDSIYVAADTLFSAKISDLYKTKDSLAVDTVREVKTLNTAHLTDSTNRYFEAYRNVRIFSDSLQAVADSLFYSFQDSTFKMYYDPVVWSRQSQISGDTLLLFTQNKKPKKFEALNNALVVNMMDPEVYNQVKSSRMDGYFMNGVIDSVRAKGNAESIYYIQDNDSAYLFIQEVQSDLIDIYFRNQELMKVVYRSQPSGTIWPINHKNPSEMKLKGFKWLEALRPKTKFELFE